MWLLRYPSRIKPPTGTHPFHSTLKIVQILQSPNLSLITANMELNRSGSKRPTCPTCSKPTRFCLCTRIENPGGIENKVSVIILQHSLEHKHPLNSARIVKLGLRNVGICSVSDVNFDAKFFIRVLEPCLGRVCCERLGFSGLGEEMRDTQKRKFDHFFGFSVNRGNVVCSGGNKKFNVEIEEMSDEIVNVKTEVLDEKANMNNEQVLDGEGDVKNVEVLEEKVIVKNEEMLDEEGVKNVLQVSNDVVIFASIRKFGAITDLGCRFLAEDCNRRRNYFDQILDSGEVINTLRSGFAVKKLQTRQVNGSTRLEEYEEFDIVVPGGTVLLFPSDNAVSIDDLKAMNIEVKNLIVLDGTWSKARRMYNENPWLRFLPHLKLDVDQWSLYSEVRKQPGLGCLSTIESIVYTLKAVGDDADGLDNLLEVFESMIGDQRRCKEERLTKVSAG